VIANCRLEVNFESRQTWPGRPFPLGTTWDGNGVNFALLSDHASSVERCLFGQEVARIPVREQTDQVWHVYLPGASPGLLSCVGFPSTSRRAFAKALGGARSQRADLIVIGTHGRTGLSRLVLGSVASRVISQAWCAVLTVRGR
jgi:hypothetical protein